jgi:hypothetical protein
MNVSTIDALAVSSLYVDAALLHASLLLLTPCTLHVSTYRLPLLQAKFSITINNIWDKWEGSATHYRVFCNAHSSCIPEDAIRAERPLDIAKPRTMDESRRLVSQLYVQLHVQQLEV